MADQKYRVGMITSTSSIIDSIKRLDLDESIEIQSCVTKVMDEAIPFGREMEQSGVEVIIGRRGTAHTLRENLSIPVLSLPVSSLDILNCIRKAMQYGHRLLLPTFRNFLIGMDIIEEIFNVEITQVVYTDSKSLEKAVQSGIEIGADAIIGGGGSLRYAQKHGLNAQELVVSDEAVAAILEDARSVAQSKREELKKAMRYHYIINSTTDAIISVNQNKKLTAINQSARLLFNVGAENIEGEPLEDHVKNKTILSVLKTGKAKINELEHVNGKPFLANYIPIKMDTGIIGAVATFRDTSKVLRAEKKLRRLAAKGLVAKYSIRDFIYSSGRMDELLKQVRRFAASDSTILINGETGTGKEIIAQSIHTISPRNKGPFVSINCGALPDQLLESELFGHEEGAFTGSRRGGKMGLFELAHTGSIFLDEIVSTPESVQTRLLRVLQEKEVMRIGGEELFPVDVRVIAAANKELSKEVETGHFREDLFFRLDVLKITIPPLRERITDLPVLVKELVLRMARKYCVGPIEIPREYLLALMQYGWPGNVRQLENFIERLVLLCGNDFRARTFDELFDELTSYRGPVQECMQPPVAPFDQPFQGSMGTEEMNRILCVLHSVGFNRSRAAEMLGMSRTTLWRKLKQAESASETKH